MSNPEIFRIDSDILPFTPRTVNGLQFDVAKDNPLKPTTPTGVFYYGPLSESDLSLYEGLHGTTDSRFTITRLGADEVSAEEAHAKLLAARADAYRAEAKKGQKAAPAPAPATKP